MGLACPPLCAVPICSRVAVVACAEGEDGESGEVGQKTRSGTAEGWGEGRCLLYGPDEPTGD